MLTRRESRILALNYLYSYELNSKEISLIEYFNTFTDVLKETEDEFSYKLFKTCVENITKIDEELKLVIDNWDYDRLTAIDKSILRLACAELSLKETALSIVINEVIEISKEYSEVKSKAFINGVLDKYSSKYL